MVITVGNDIYDLNQTGFDDAPKEVTERGHCADNGSDG